MGASSCTKPFVVQELVIAAKELLVHRAKLYRDSKASAKGATSPTYGLEEHELTSLSERCSFATLETLATILLVVRVAFTAQERHSRTQWQVKLLKS